MARLYNLDCSSSFPLMALVFWLQPLFLSSQSVSSFCRPGVRYTGEVPTPLHHPKCLFLEQTHECLPDSWAVEANVKSRS